ncbi:MAG: hypothetical protein WC521_07090 [Bdellovibrionales bacterium]|jgi:hypothetical protein
MMFGNEDNPLIGMVRFLELPHEMQEAKRRESLTYTQRLKEDVQNLPTAARGAVDYMGAWAVNAAVVGGIVALAVADRSFETIKAIRQNHLQR